MKPALIAPLILLALTASCKRAEAPTAAKPPPAEPVGPKGPQGPADYRDAFDVAIPQECEIETKGPVADFQVYYVNCKGTTYAGIYVGDFADKTMTRSRLMSTPYRYPTQVQAWSNDVPGDQAKADAIAASVKVRPLAKP